MTLSPIDLILIAAYIGSLFILGYRFKKKQSDENFLLAARKLSLPAFVMTLVTTWYGAILGVGEFVFGFGMVGWVTNGLFWYIVYIGFAYLLSKRIHDSGHTTVADHLKDRIGKKSAGIGSILTYIITTPHTSVPIPTGRPASHIRHVTIRAPSMHLIQCQPISSTM